ncbi:hypothetical protein, partial [Providencia stuartii]|uniref:hypothetical protein n=3 Tax=Providencia stuartii TaxID=588 RepID=UPI0024AC4111
VSYSITVNLFSILLKKPLQIILHIVFKLKSSLFFVNKRKVSLIGYKTPLKLRLIDINSTISPLSCFIFEKKPRSGGDLCNKSAILLAQRKLLALLARI